jgi:hypothetical protein
VGLVGVAVGAELVEVVTGGVTLIVVVGVAVGIGLSVTVIVPPPKTIQV